MNLLSIGAAYGLLIVVFQWGWGKDLFGVAKTGPIEVFLPMMLFAVLFGLSMDYEVFLLSRIREDYLRTGDSGAAVAHGLSATARVIAAAAAIMVVVFLSFVFGADRTIKEFGLGLSSAILIDATIVRLALVPATMELLGDWNWWLPGWLDRLLPRLNIEGSVPHLPTPAPPQPEPAGQPAD
jgi:RND superfamily putative drug exporter